MKRPFLILYGLASYLLFNLSFVYMLGFLQSVGVPKAVNDGAISPPQIALAINLFLIFLFGFFHSLMARDGFKRWWTRLIPADAERPTYVLQSAVFLLIAMAFWQPMTQVIWQVEGAAATAVLALFGLGVLLLLTSTFLIDHFELFGLKHVWFASRDRDLPETTFVQPFLYRIVRHPMQLGMIILLFASPHMTLGHLVFAISMAAYVLVGLYFEERALVRQFGESYRQYQQRVPMLVPGLKFASGRAPSAHAETGGA